MSLELVFVKTGKEIKVAIAKRLESLESRLEKRNVELNKLLKDSKKIRSYVLRSTESNHYGHGGRLSTGATLYSKDHISSEEVEEINQMCTRIMEIEQEVEMLKLTVKHLNDEKEFELNFPDLVNYGFE